MSDELINIDIEKYIKDLSPELQEKARACKSYRELADLATENKVPLPDEALEYVAGGKGEREMTFPNWYRLNMDIADLRVNPWAHKGNRVYVITSRDGYIAKENEGSSALFGVFLYDTKALDFI